jgi:hypothetical protein
MYLLVIIHLRPFVCMGKKYVFSVNEKLKGSFNKVKDFMVQTVQDTDALKRYEYINVNYQWLLATQK